MCRYFGIEFVDFVLKGKGLLEYTHLFSPNKYKTNDKKTLILLNVKCVKKYEA